MSTTALARILGLAVLLAIYGSVLFSPGTAAQDSATSPEQALAERFAPSVMIKQQQEACSTDGEPFRPVVVDILFGTGDVRLMKRGSGGLTTDTEIKRNIQASDLAGLDSTYYLDLPGNPRDPQCTYEKWGQKRMAELGIEPSIYARVTTDAGKVVVQYWYYWVFNYFNNTHESDWEGIQLSFDADDPQQVLDQNLLPSNIAFAQHEGGEQASWDDDKVETDGTHIVTHPSSGSHADYYEAAVWLGWGEHGSGFGCDYSNEPSVELPVSIVMLPSDAPDPAGEFAWLTYTGLWGQRGSPSMFSGPTGPNTKPRWDEPIDWEQGLRAASLPVPIRTTIGPGISQVFCGAAEFGARVVRVFPIDPKVVAGFLGAVAIALLILAAMAWRTFVKAIRLYLRYGYFFITLGVIAFPLAWIGQRIEEWLQHSVLAYIDPRLPSQIHSGSIYQFLFHSGLGGVQEILLACIIGPITIYATAELSRSPDVNWRHIQEHAVERFPAVLGATGYVALLLTLMSLTFILIPLALYKAVQWFFTPEAVLLDNASWREARHVSAQRMRGHWIRALALVVAMGAVAGLPGPLIGTLGLIMDWMHLEQAQWVSAGIYCVLYPIALIMATLFYLRISTAPGLAQPHSESA